MVGQTMGGMDGETIPIALTGDPEDQLAVMGGMVDSVRPPGLPAVPPGAMVISRAGPPTTQKVTFVGEFQDVEVPCFKAEFCQDGLLLTTASSQQIKLRPLQAVILLVDGAEHVMTFTGISTTIESFGITVRLFLNS